MQSNKWLIFFILGNLFLLQSCQKADQPADLIINNAAIWTGNEIQKMASSMAIINDTIALIGNHKEINLLLGASTEVIDMNGAFITPGFIDSHVHLLMGGNSLLSVQLRDASTPQEFSKRIADFAKTIEPGTWILEGNWDHTLWGGELPHKDWIDEFTRDKPVVLFRLDGHMVLANSAALDRAGIDQNTPDPESGQIVRDQNGQPTGILKSNAMNAVLDQIPALTRTQKENAFRAAMTYFSAHGVTSVHDVDSLSCYDIAQALQTKNELQIRIYNIDPLYKWQYTKDEKNKWLRRGGVKGFVDGSLGSHTAAFHHHYSDKSDDTGLFLYDPEQLYQWVSDADKANLQVMVHAIGDKANHTILNIFERVIKENGKKDRRFRIEHAQHLSPSDIHRFSELGVIASVQPYHAIDDGRWAEEVIGAERIKTTYAFKSLLDANAILAFGSDWAVAPASPILGIYAAVTRSTLDDKNPNGWVPEQKITVEQALEAYTKNAAYAAFEEDLKGTLEPGKFADFVVLSADVRTVDPMKIKDIKVLQTFVGGRKVFELE